MDVLFYCLCECVLANPKSQQIDIKAQGFILVKFKKLCLVYLQQRFKVDAWTRERLF